MVYSAQEAFPSGEVMSLMGVGVENVVLFVWIKFFELWQVFSSLDVVYVQHVQWAYTLSIGHTGHVLVTGLCVL